LFCLVSCILENELDRATVPVTFMELELLAEVATRAAAVAWALKVAAAIVPALLLLSRWQKQHRGPIDRALPLKCWCTTDGGTTLRYANTKMAGMTDMAPDR
jgi:hypothetical protein